MGCVQSYFKRAHTAVGLSPSSTQDSNSKAGANDDEAKPIIAEERSITEEPESNDTSYGVEATAVRTLAASTGTVAILGTTAKTSDKNGEDEEKQVETIPEEENEKLEETRVISIEKVEVHEPNLEEKCNNVEQTSKSEGIENIQLKEEKTEESNVPTTQLPSNGSISSNTENLSQITKEADDIEKEINKENNIESIVLSRESDSNKVCIVNKAEISESPVCVVKIEGEKTENTTTGINQDAEEDNSKSISSERLKTNSLSDTTLSESYNNELENNSVKQSPSVEKVLESFDSSSTVEFVDTVNKDVSRSKRSIDDDLIDGSISSTPLRSTSVDVISKENVTTPTDVTSEKGNLLSATDVTKEENSESGNNAASPEQVVESELNEVENNLDKIQNEDKIPSVNNSLNIEKETIFSSSAVSEPIESNISINNINGSSIEGFAQSPIETVSRQTDESHKNLNEHKNDVHEFDDSDKLVSAATTIQATFRGYQTRQNLKTEKPVSDNSVPESESNQETTDQINSAATTIQATFRGYQERKHLKSDNENLDQENINKNVENTNNATEVVGLINNINSDIISTTINQNVNSVEAEQEVAEPLKEVNNELNSAATTIQATFRGFQARQNLKNSEPEKLPELPDNNLEVGNELNDAATTIQATFRGFQARQNLKNSEPEKLPELPDNNLEVGNELNDAATTIQATFRGYKARQNLKNDDLEKESFIEESVNEESGDLEKLNSAATTIQSTFRGFQARQNLQKDDNKVNDKEDEPLVNLNENVQDNVITNESENLEDVNKEEISKEANNEKLESAATTIQATFRGHQVRQNLKNTNQENNEILEEAFVDVSNEELNSAATKIQANFRGFQTRKQFKNENDDVKPEVEENKEENTVNDSEQLTSAATTIQAAFRGFQTRQELKREEVIGDQDVEESLATLDEVIKAESADLINYNSSEEQEPPKIDEQSVNAQDELDDKLHNAASTIQATFRGFQTRQNLKNINKNEENLNNDQSIDCKTPVSLTPEIIESVKEEVDEICKQAIATTESILAADKKESLTNNVDKVNEDVTKDVDNVSEETPVTHKETVSNSDIVQINNSSSLIQTSENVQDINVNNKIDIAPEDTKEFLLEDTDGKLTSAATTIQASFRGFQTRQNLQKVVENEEQPDSMPDYPPPAMDDESLFGPPVADDDLPPPDFEALESSYSEDVPTEPLAPPPIDHDSLKFNEEDEFDEELQALQKPQECDELPEHRLTLESDASTEIESSLSSAATKIQSGVRGFLTRRQFQNVQKGTDSTSAPSIVDSDRSVGDFSGSHEEEGPVRSAISIEEESEICKHRNSPDKEDLFDKNILDLKKRQGKRMSLGNNLHEAIPKQRKQRALSVQIHRDNVTDEEVWMTLKNEMSSAATLIQSNYRGYRARKQLQREDAVLVQTSSSSQATPAAGSLDIKEIEPHPTRSSGEYHDIIVLTPPNIQKDKPPEES